MIITISGLPGSGKSTVAKALAQKLDYKHYSMGDMRGKMALERGMTIEELNKLGEKESFTDKEVDEYQAQLGKTEDNFVIDSRLGWHFIPQSFKVFLKVDEQTAAERVFQHAKKGARPDEPSYESVEDVMSTLRSRLESDNKRYKKYYNIEYAKPENYDLVIDTTEKTVEEVVDAILQAVKKGKL